MKLDISEDALGDLDEILSFSIRQWGPARAFDYIADIRAKAEALARGDLSGMEADEIGPGLRRQIVGAHVIWFRVEAERLRVIRVLHQSRDAGRWVG